jgi:hypothetical protein
VNLTKQKELCVVIKDKDDIDQRFIYTEVPFDRDSVVSLLEKELKLTLDRANFKIKGPPDDKKKKDFEQFLKDNEKCIILIY